MVNPYQGPSNIEILPFSSKQIRASATLFIENYKRQQQVNPLLPDLMGERSHVEGMLANSFNPQSGLVAVDNGELKGFLFWFLVDHFRDTSRKGAYVPEWGHGCHAYNTRIYQALYRAAGERWAEAGCQVHAITVLAEDKEAERIWYWNGFGLTVVDGIRPAEPLDIKYQTTMAIRKANAADAASLTELDAEHCIHYTKSPIFMAPRRWNTVEENLEFMSRPKNSVWLAEDNDELVGFIRFEGYDFDCATILESDESVSITGAYVRPAYRKQRLGAIMLNSAMRYYQSMDLKYCSTNFESFNPEAASFWMKYFEPVCYSLLRVPEA